MALRRRPHLLVGVPLGRLDGQVEHEGGEDAHAAPGLLEAGRGAGQAAQVQPHDGGRLAGGAREHAVLLGVVPQQLHCLGLGQHRATSAGSRQPSVGKWEIGGRERETHTQAETERERERERGGQRDTHTHRQRETEEIDRKRRRERETKRRRERDTHRQRKSETGNACAIRNTAKKNRKFTTIHWKICF